MKNVKVIVSLIALIALSNASALQQQQQWQQTQASQKQFGMSTVALPSLDNYLAMNKNAYVNGRRNDQWFSDVLAFAKQDFTNPAMIQWLTEKQRSDIPTQVNLIADKVASIAIESARNNNLSVTEKDINNWLFNDWPLVKLSQQLTPLTTEQKQEIAKQKDIQQYQRQQQQQPSLSKDLGALENVKTNDLITIIDPISLKTIMPQLQLLVQKDALQNLVKNVWENCLKILDVKFPGLTEQNTIDEHVVNVKWDFEKQPRTDDNILFIKKTVQDVIATTLISSIKFDQQKKATQEQMLKGILERMIANALIELLLKDVGESLDWCTCTAEYKRITLALLLVNEIREKFPNKNQRIVYTSFASGSLLQDYVALSELLLSHTNILVNFIDLEYPDIPALAKKDLSAKKPRDLHMIEMKNKQECANMIDSFKVKIAQIISQRKSDYGNYNFEVNIYQNAYEYIARVQKNPAEKSNILIMVDPSVGSFGMADFPSLANVINVFIDQEEAPDFIQKFPVFTLYLPRHHGAHLYEATDVANSQIMHSLHDQLLQLVVSTGANKNYTPRLVKAFLERTINFDKQITDELLSSSFPRLMQIRADLKKQALEEGYAGDNLLQPLTPVKLGDVPILLSWGADAHISFQDLVWDALAPNAIVYQLYAIDPKSNNQDENNKIIKINPEVYKKVDVVSPNSGASNSGYKRIL